jgi:hypothetical protein
MTEFEKIKEKYRTVSIIESINGIDIVAVDTNDLWFFIAAIEQNDDLREQLKQTNKHIQELESEIVVIKNVNNSI